MKTGKRINHNPQNLSDTFPDISSGAMFGTSSGSNIVFHDIQSNNTASWPTFPGGEKARESFSSRGQFCFTSPASGLNFCSSNMQPTSKKAFERFSANYASPSMNGCPRVFCMGKSGHLLISNTWLLGIVCSCHCCHMSILKFCEHSGLHSVNPGDVVRMESGETIAQWQKLYFLKFGIRSSGNESEWDWPEVFSTTGNLMKSNASASDMSKSDLSHILNSAAVTLRKQPIPNQDGCNIPLKGLNAFMQNNLYDRVKSQLMESNMANSTPAPNFVGVQLNDGCQPIPPFLDSLKRDENLSITQSTQIPTSHKDHACIKKKNLKTGILDKDATFSDIELRLGQPHRAGNLVASFVESPLFTFASSPKPHSLKQMTNNLSREEELQNNISHAAGSFKMLEEQPLLNPPYYMSGCSNISGAATSSSQTYNVAMSSLFSPFTQFTSQPKGNTNASGNLVNDGIMPKNPHSEYGTVQFGSSNVLWNSNGHKGRQSNDSAPEFNKYLENVNGARVGEDSRTKINSGFEVNQFMEFGSIRRTVGGSGSCTPVVSKKIYESSFASDTSVGANALQGSKNVFSFGQSNHLTLGTAVPFEENLKSLPYLVSSSTLNQNSTPKQWGINMDTYMLDENMRLLALTQMLELSKQQQALYFHDMNQKLGKTDIPKPQNYIYKASVPEPGSSGASLKLPQNRGTCGNLEITDGIHKLTGYAHWHTIIFLSSFNCFLSLFLGMYYGFSFIVCMCLRVIFLAGLNRYCDVSALTPIPLQSKEKESQCKHSYNLQNDGPSLSLGMNNTRSSEKCAEQQSDIHFAGKYASAAWENCCRNNVCTGIEPSRNIVKEKFADVNGVTSLKIVSECSRDQKPSRNKNIYFELSGLDSHDTVKIGSHTPQWRDVPRKVSKPLCDATILDQMATILDCEGQDSAQMGNISTKRLKNKFDREGLLKEREILNVSSGCSAPVVSQASGMEVNKVDSCNVDTTYAGCIENLVLDEVLGIDKGWSSDLVESERSAEYAGSTSGSDLKKGYPRVLNDQPCRSLLDDIKLLDSLIWKKGQDQNHIMVSANCRASQSQKVKKGFKGKEPKRNKVRVLGASLLPGISCSLNNQIGESPGSFDPPSSLSEEMQLYFSSSQQRSYNKVSIVQPITSHRPSSFSSKFLSCNNNNLNKHHRDEDCCESESNSHTEFHTLPGISRIKKSRKVFTSDCFGHFQMQVPHYDEPKNATQMLSSSRKGSAHRIKRPVVCGKYGEISSELSITEVPKPAKIVSLSKVLRTSKRCMIPTTETPSLTAKKKQRTLGFETSWGHSCAKSGLKAKKDNESEYTIICDETNSDVSMEDFERGCKQTVVYKGKRDAKERQGDILSRADSPLKVKSREIRKQRSINEIITKETQMQDMLKYAEDHEHSLCNKRSNISVQEHRNLSITNSDSFCGVCQRSSNDEVNSLLKCSKCLIKVRQAGYGISALPKRGLRGCRPCQTNSKDIVCSICNQRGGSCIECRNVDCSVKFHPCSHQKNPLQIETEGINEEKVSFYRRSVLHGIGPEFQSTYDPTDEMDSREEKEFTCARTEGYKGRKWDGIQNNHTSALKLKGECRVPDEQLNAWIHINGKELSSKGILKFPDSDIEHDSRKTCSLHKQVKGLFVYKSGIHGLGLYTSQLISQGRMSM
ncbi:uncharacterized protein LOC123915468 isoform X4 [Trifolium pratense]|uniref:uncharacterized protein LOC123915468 isoform X4 n=1 Tax=Trifolium pratense TaxID=57577 RepID=UPI001E69281F|nr:uncharacterized protein LOC123915468 isoform X4 [Trifolium pratense]